MSRIDTKCCLCMLSPSHVMAGEHGNRHTMRAHKRQAVSDWLNELTLGTMSASDYIANFDKNSTWCVQYR